MRDQLHVGMRNPWKQRTDRTDLGFLYHKSILGPTDIGSLDQIGSLLQHRTSFEIKDLRDTCTLCTSQERGERRGRLLVWKCASGSLVYREFSQGASWKRHRGMWTCHSGHGGLWSPWFCRSVVPFYFLICTVVKGNRSPPPLPSQSLPYKVLQMSHDQSVGLGLDHLEINHFFSSVWTGQDLDSVPPRAPFKILFRPCVYFMENFTRLFLIHFQLKAQNAGFVRVLWWFRFLLVDLCFFFLFPPQSPQKFNKCCSGICMLNCSK